MYTNLNSTIFDHQTKINNNKNMIQKGQKVWKMGTKQVL